jgi:hypothetical protein
MPKRSSFLSGIYRSEIIGLICRTGKRNQGLIRVNFRCRVIMSGSGMRIRTFSDRLSGMMFLYISLMRLSADRLTEQ